MAKVQQIKTSVRCYNLLPAHAQLLATVGKLIKLDEFWAHSFLSDLGTSESIRGWRLTDLRDGWFKMAETKTKRNGRRSKRHGDFQIRSEPIVRVAGHCRSSHVAERMALPRVYDRPTLFVIAQDQYTIFVSWNIDWRCLFEKAMPADRQVYLRVIDGDGLEQKRVAVEPMLGNFYAALSQTRATYRVELGYFTLDCGWKSVAVSEPVAMPADAPSENTQVDVATVPFHISFQKLVDLLSLTNSDPLVTVLSRLEDRIVAFAERDVDLAPADREILRTLNISIDDLRAGSVSFAERPKELQLGKRAEAILALGATSPTSGFSATSWSQ
jgi:hypothetical protein